MHCPDGTPRAPRAAGFSGNYLRDDLDAVRHCNQLLGHLEQRLIDD